MNNDIIEIAIANNNNNSINNKKNEKLKIEVDENNFKFIKGRYEKFYIYSENCEFSNFEDKRAIAFGEDCVSVMLLDGFKESLEPGVLPNVVGSIPSTVSEFIFHDGFNQSLEPGIIPRNYKVRFPFSPMEGAQHLTLHNIKSELNIGSIPESVHQLILKDGFSQTLKPVVIPKTVSSLILQLITQPLIIGSIPNTVSAIFFHKDFNQLLTAGIIPECVKRLVFHQLHLGKIKQPLLVNSIPNSVTYLNITNGFNQALTPGIIPNSIDELILGSVNTQIVEGSIPKTIKTIILKY
ncbi:hypothetical protein ACTFIY_001175 [Dictyostelium cf. discoideum]